MAVGHARGGEESAMKLNLFVTTASGLIGNARATGFGSSLTLIMRRSLFPKFKAKAGRPKRRHWTKVLD